MSAPVWLVTGAGSGVGRTLALALAASGAEVILTARNRSRLEETAQRAGSSSVVLPADLSDVGSLDGLAGEVGKRLAGRPLAGIVHAAGVMLWDSPSTAAGWSLVPWVNALAPWRLTLNLEPLLLAGSGSRVLFVAGAPFTLKGIHPDPSHWKGAQKGRGLTLALESAAAKVLMVRSLHDRWGGRAAAFAFDPGFVKSHLAGGLPFPLNALGFIAQPFLSARSGNAEFLALDPAALTLSGSLVSGRRAVPDCPFPKEKASEEAFFALLE